MWVCNTHPTSWVLHVVLQQDPSQPSAQFSQLTCGTSLLAVFATTLLLQQANRHPVASSNGNRGHFRMLCRATVVVCT